jgi:PTS system nitrogen regulatory IIA component
MPTSDFDVDSLAVYLHLTPQQVTRLAERGRLPARKVAGEWRFSRAEIHHWWEDRIGLSDEDELVEVEEVLNPPTTGGRHEEIVIADILPVEAIEIPLRARTRASVFPAMAQVAARTGWLWDPDKMAEALRAREEMHPTALDNGVALLHPRRPTPGILGQAFLALGIAPSGIPFGGGRGGLTDVFFLICSVEDRGHLRTLARLSRVIGAPGVLESLRQAPGAAAAHQIVKQAEQALAG